ncbi:MAG TPA: hypothetical protein VLE71_05560 [Actinomycetota bacterium]|nr:hypothetical protein [Actinomycetota bacterium]
MELGTSKPGTVAPALVAFLVLAGSAALAATQEPTPNASPGRPAVTPVQTGRLGHQGDEAPEESVTPDATSPTVDVEGCGNAMTDGDTALEHAHGLDRAIQAILERCGRGSTTQGLLNALEHLRENKAKHEARGNQGQRGEDHGKPSDHPGKSDENPGKSGQDHGKAGGQPQDDGGGGPASPPGGGNEVREGGGPPDDHGPGNR